METKRHAIPREHPRVMGSRAQLQALAKARPEAYQRMAAVARATSLPEWPGPSSIGKLIAMGFTAAVEQDYRMARQAVDLVLQTYIRQPIRTGHIPFGSDVGYSGLIYDLCHESWLPYERSEFHAFMNRSRQLNVNEETSPFHNAWYHYKMWGFGVACYATMYENPSAQQMLRDIEQEYLQRAVPCLKIAGDGGGLAKASIRITGSTPGSFSVRQRGSAKGWTISPQRPSSTAIAPSPACLRCIPLKVNVTPTAISPWAMRPAAACASATATGHVLPA